MSLRLVSALLLTALVFILAGAVAWRLTVPPPAPIPTASAEFVLPGPGIAPVRIRHKVSTGETLSTILDPWGIDAHSLRKDALAFHDLSRLRVGRQIQLIAAEGDSEISELRYEMTEDDELVAVRAGPGWSVRVESASWSSRTTTLRFTVERTLWDAAIGAGLRAGDIMELARVFESDIDFNTEVQAGARIEMVVDRMTRDDGFEKLGPPQAARFVNGDKTLMATRFQVPGGKAEYLDDEGVRRRGAFLRSPLEFSNVTSGFNKARFHPILKTRRPHMGTDFGAPTGTPVRSVANGTVVRAGKAGGHGNYIEIQHDKRYRTSYSHLSRIGVRKGESVAQGQVIGAVGSTGMSTGPHLHFQLWIDNKLVDPMSAVLPRFERIEEQHFAAFEAERLRLRALLDGDATPSTD